MPATLEMPIELAPVSKVTEAVELQGFLWISDLFKERDWPNPIRLEIDEEITGQQLLIQLAVPTQQVSLIFVNHRAYEPSLAIIRPGDRVALVPPGVPMPF